VSKRVMAQLFSPKTAGYLNVGSVAGFAQCWPRPD
jgi:hypothetical protein